MDWIQPFGPSYSPQAADVSVAVAGADHRCFIHLDFCRKKAKSDIFRHFTSQRQPTTGYAAVGSRSTRDGWSRSLKEKGNLEVLTKHRTFAIKNDRRKISTIFSAEGLP